MNNSFVISSPGAAFSLKNEIPFKDKPIVLYEVLVLLDASEGLIGIFIVMHCSSILLGPAEAGVPVYPAAVLVAAYL